MPRSAPINVILIGHPEDRMAQRSITRADIERCLRCCFDHYLGDEGSTCHVGLGMDGEGRHQQEWRLPASVSDRAHHSEVRSVERGIR